MDDSAGPDFSDDTVPFDLDVAPSPEVLDRAVEDDLDGLTDLLFHGRSQKLREDAALAIGMLMGEKAVGPFIGLFSQEDRDLRLAASWGLSAIGMTAVEGLIAALSADDTDTRMWTAYTLGTIGHRKAEFALGEALKDDDAGVRWWVSWALDQILQRRGCCSGC